MSFINNKRLIKNRLILLTIPTGYFGLSFLYCARKRRMERIDNEASINDNSNQSGNQINPRQWQTVFPVISIATWRQFHSKLGDTEETKDQRVHPTHSHNECFRFSMNRQLINHAYAESFEFTWITYFTCSRRYWRNPKSRIDRSELIWNFRETIGRLIYRKSCRWKMNSSKS